MYMHMYVCLSDFPHEKRDNNTIIKIPSNIFSIFPNRVRSFMAERKKLGHIDTLSMCER